MLIIRIMQAEAAVAGGRLDEAVDRLADRRVRDHRRGQALVDRLVAALVARGREHLTAGRPPQALADADKAAALGGNLPDVAAVRAAAAAAVREADRAARDADRAVAAARRHVAVGHASAGERLLAPLVHRTAGGGEVQAVMIMEDLAARRETLAAALRSAEAALEADAIERAATALARGRGANLADARLDELTAQAAGVFRRRVSDAVRQGRLDVADSLAGMWAGLAGAADPDVEGEHLRRAVTQFRVAWQQFQAGRPRDAEAVLRRMAAAGPAAGAAWAEQAMAQLRQAAEATEAVRAGPLGLLAAADGLTETRDLVRPARVPPAVPAAAGGRPGVGPPAAASALPASFVLRVDGVGSFLVLRQPRVTIGPVSASPPPDLAVIADAGLPPVAVERRDDDYFVRPVGPPSPAATVNRRPLGGSPRLLVGGDRLALSPRCRLTFALPSPASTSAVLDLTGAKLPAADVRRVILMDRDLILGPGPTAHVRTDTSAAGGPAGGPAVVLHVRDDRLCCSPRRDAGGRGAAVVLVDSRPVDPHAGLPMNVRVLAGELSFVVAPA